MSRLTLLLPGLLAFSLSACGPLEVRIGAAEGVKPLTGNAAAKIDTTATSTFHCGDVITAQDNLQTYTVTSAVVTGGCQFTFDQKVEVLSVKDYDEIKEFRAAVHFIHRVEIDMKRLEFFDDNGAKFELDSRIRDLEVSINGEQLMNQEQIRLIPHTLVLAGSALTLIKEAVKNKQACSLQVMAKVTLIDTAVPTGIRVEYDSQPTYVGSTVEL